jgi:hypothetical protein
MITAVQKSSGGRQMKRNAKMRIRKDHPAALRIEGADDAMLIESRVGAEASDNCAVGMIAVDPMVDDAGEPANDNVGEFPPRPGGASALAIAIGTSAPLVWDQDDPYVRRLKAELTEAFAAASGIPERRALRALLLVAEGDGELPSFAGKVAQKAFCKAHGLAESCWARGTKAKEQLDRFVPRFRLAGTETRLSSRCGYRPNINYVGLMRDCIVLWARDGVAIPTRGKRRICLRGVAALMNVDYFKLREQKGALALLYQAVRCGVLALGEPMELPPEMTREEVEARRAELFAVVDGYDVPGGKVPESLMRRGLVDWEYLASLTGRVQPTMEHDWKYRSHVKKIVERRGLMPPGLMLHKDTISAFTLWGLDRIAAENVGKPSCAAIVANHKAALNRFANALGLGAEDEAGPMFAVGEFDGNLAAALTAFENTRSAANFKRMVEKWRVLHAARVGANELPESVNEAFDMVLKLRGLTPSAFARALNVDKQVILRIVTSVKGLSMADIDVLRRSEAKLGLPSGTLLTKVKHVATNLDRMAGASEAYRALSKRYRALLPDEAALWPAERLQAALDQVSPLISNGTEYARRCSLARQPEQRAAPFDPCPRLRQQLDDYRAYKCAPVAYPFVRPNRARWKKEGTADVRMRQVEGVLRYMQCPPDGGPSAGLGAPKDGGTIVWLAHAPFALASCAQRASRFAHGTGEAAERGRVYTVSERDTIAHLVSMTNPVTGWFVQNPHLANELVPLDVRVPPEHTDMLKLFGISSESLLLTEEDVAFARRDWSGYVGRNHQALLQAMGYIDDVLEVSRNPFIPLAGCVNADEPMAELMVAILNAERMWANPSTNPYAYQGDVRDSVMHRLAAMTSLRPDNLATASFTGDERGEIRKIDGRWMIEISYRKFKNYKSARLFGTSTARRNYELELRDEAGLYDLLDLYFYEVRPSMRVIDCDAAFFSTHGRPMNVRSWYDIVTAFGIKHIAWNPVLRTGIPGMIKMNPYAFRHIRATDILKNGVSFNRLEEAAFALQTSELMIQRHYGNLLPKDAVTNANATFDRALKIALKRNAA